MGKRKHKDKRSHGRKKRRYQKHPRYYESDLSSSSEEEYYEEDKHTPYYPDPRNFDTYYAPTYSNGEYDFPLSESDASVTAHTIKSVITVNKESEPTTNIINSDYGNIADLVTNQCQSAIPVTRAAPSSSAPPSTSAGPSPSASVDHTVSAPLDTQIQVPGASSEVTATLSADILEALGDPKGKEEVFGPKIPEEIAKRWGRVLVDGLTKEQKQELSEKSLIPENFRLAKAPLLNPEIIPVLSEPARNRDKLLEKSQNQLGLGISKLTNLAAAVIDGNIEKIEILKKISEASQIFLDLHHEDTKRRRKLITSSLDKRFLSIINEVKRDTYLIGQNLGEKIKTSKTAERSGLQIKRTDNSVPALRKYPQQGNWKGPPRAPAPRAYRQSGHKNRYPQQPSRRPPQPPTDRQYRAVTKPTVKIAKN